MHAYTLCAYYRALYIYLHHLSMHSLEYCIENDICRNRSTILSKTLYKCSHGLNNVTAAAAAAPICFARNLQSWVKTFTLQILSEESRIS